MSEHQRPGSRRVSLDPPADALTLEAMAVVEAFAEACVRGEAPSLSEWLRRYPEHAAALADYAAIYVSEQGVTEVDTAAERELSPGTLRALDTISDEALAGGPRGSHLRVAEAPSSYDAGATKDRED